MNIYHMTGQLRDDLKKLERENQSLRKAAEAARVALESLVQKAHKHNWPTQYPDLYANAETVLAGLRAELSPDR